MKDIATAIKLNPNALSLGFTLNLMRWIIQPAIIKKPAINPKVNVSIDEILIFAIPIVNSKLRMIGIV